MSWFRSSKRPEDRALDPDFGYKPERETVSPRKEDRVLSLQRNQSVQKHVHAEGSPIPEAERNQMEAAFGQDLSEVRVHRDEDAADLTAGASASAFTTGRDIYFAPGAYSSAALAHEVSHVIQQSQAASFVPGEDASLEHQANDASSAFMAGRTAEISAAASAPALQRQPAPGAAPPPVRLLPTDSLTLDAFDIDKSALSGTNKQKLDEFAKRLQNTLASAPDSIVTIVGFADAPGTEPHNLALGLERAAVVRDYLTAKGISPGQLNATSLGEASPLVPGKGYEAKNRRVEINVVERSPMKPVLPATPPAPAPVPKEIDLKYHPERHTPDPDKDFQEKFRQIDRAVREAQEEEKANRGTSLSDAAGHILRNAARKLGLPEWVQHQAESLGRNLPSAGAQGALDQLAGETNMDANTRNALKALVDALMRTKVK